MLFSNSVRKYSATKNKKLVKLMRRDLLRLSPKKNTSMKNFLVPIPRNFLVTIIKNQAFSSYRVFLCSPLFYVNLLIPINFSTLYFEKESSNLHYSSVYSSNLLNAYYLSISSLLLSFSKVSFKKVKFKGKGYYIYKNKRNTIAPQFGYSHRIYIYSCFTAVKFTSKSSLIFFGLQNYEVNKISQSLQYFRKLNIFTGRGVRFSRQTVYSKPGKISSYR